MAKQKETVSEEQYHVYDFIIRTGMSRSEQEVMEKKFANAGLHTFSEWENLTGHKLLTILK